MKAMLQIDGFFINENYVGGITEADYEQAAPVVEGVKAFAKATYQSIYIIDYFKKGFLYVSNNPLFLCGRTAEDVLDMGYNFYLEHVPQEELPMLLELNRAGFSLAELMSDEEKINSVISYDFHLTNHGHPQLIHHKLTPLQLFDGRIWLAICTVSLSSRKEAGHITLRTLGKPNYWEYVLDRHRWEERQPIELKPEEKQILTLAAQGYAIKEIAGQMNRSPDTIKHFRRRIFEKLGAVSVTEAVTFAANYRLL